MNTPKCVSQPRHASIAGGTYLARLGSRAIAKSHPAPPPPAPPSVQLPTAASLRRYQRRPLFNALDPGRLDIVIGALNPGRLDIVIIALDPGRIDIVIGALDPGRLGIVIGA